MTTKTITGHIIEGPYVLLGNPADTTAVGNLMRVTQWTDMIASTMVLTALLVWVIRRQRSVGIDFWNRILRWTVTLLLAILGFNVAMEILGWRAIGSPILGWCGRMALPVNLIAWGALLLLLVCHRLREKEDSWRTATPLVLPTLVGNAYMTVNYFVLVHILGCGCNFQYFNSNDFSALFFVGLLLACTVGLASACRTIHPGARFWYLALGIPAVVFLCWVRLESCQWL